MSHTPSRVSRASIQPQPRGDTFDYDHENRLTQAVISGAASLFTYNGDALRMSHTANSVTTDYAWDVAAGLPVVLQDGDSTYVYGLDLISATDGAGVQTYFLYDGLGSTAGLTDGNGNVVAGYGYDVFGALRSDSPGATDFLFTGEQLDADSEMYYLRARYYDPETGRFLTEDPLTGSLYNPQTQNRFPYVANNATSRLDPSGLKWFDGGEGGGGGKCYKEGSNFSVQCPFDNYVVINGVCQEVFDPSCPPGLNPLLCGNGEDDFLTKAAKTTGTAVVDFLGPDESDFLVNRQPSDCGLQFGSWCAHETLEFIWRNPQCFGSSLATVVQVYFIYQSGGALAPVLGESTVLAAIAAAEGCTNLR